MMVEIRSMEPQDVVASEQVWHEAWNDLRRRAHLPGVEVTPAVAERMPSDRDVEVGWLTANQQWAVDASLRAGLELNPAGPVMIRGRRDPPSPYLPNGAYG